MRVASVGSVNLTGSDKHGNIEYLSYSMKDANALRFESPDTMNCWIYGRMRTSRSSCVMTCAMEIFLI